MGATITERTVVVAAPDQVSADLDGETVILNAANGTYYGLDEVGTRVWDLIQEPRTFAQIRDAIVGEYDVSLDVFSRDLADLLTHMGSESLIELKDASDS